VDKNVQELVARTLTRKMKRGVTLVGQVAGANGDAVSKPKVWRGFGQKPIEGDESGRFEIRNLSPGEMTFTVGAEGFAPKPMRVAIALGMKPIRIELGPGGLLRLRTVDEEGSVVPEVEVRFVNPHFDKSDAPLDWEWMAQSDSSGMIEWHSAPPDRQLEFYAYKDGYTQARNVHARADGEVHDVVLRQAIEVAGFVVDEETGKPISEFKAIPGYGAGETGWHRGDTRKGKDGVFKLALTEANPLLRVRIEAEGYEPGISEAIKSRNEGMLRFALKRDEGAHKKTAAAKMAIRGVVLDANDQPVLKAKVAVLTRATGVALGRGKFVRPEFELVTETDNNTGAFEIKVDRAAQAHSVVAVANGGFGRVRLTASEGPVIVRLQPLGAIKGRVDRGAIKTPFKTVLVTSATERFPGGVGLDSTLSMTTPDAEGNFILEGLPPGLYRAYIGDGEPGVPFHHPRLVTVAAGGVSELLRRRGRSFVGGWLAKERQHWDRVCSRRSGGKRTKGMRVRGWKIFCGRWIFGRARKAKRWRLMKWLCRCRFGRMVRSAAAKAWRPGSTN
jgi:hypothetical protein